MRIFNLAEELEKERKKNKELQDRIDSAINYIKITNEDLLKCDNFLSHDEIIEKKRLNELLDILKGDNK